MVNLQKKEQFAKKTLYESQIKWTHFSSDIVRVCKELINALEQHQISQYTVKLDSGVKGPARNLLQIKDKITKYDFFLQNNKQELDSKEYAQSLGILPKQQTQPSFDEESSIVGDRAEPSNSVSNNDQYLI